MSVLEVSSCGITCRVLSARRAAMSDKTQLSQAAERRGRSRRVSLGDSITRGRGCKQLGGPDRGGAASWGRRLPAGRQGLLLHRLPHRQDDSGRPHAGQGLHRLRRPPALRPGPPGPDVAGGDHARGVPHGQPVPHAAGGQGPAPLPPGDLRRPVVLGSGRRLPSPWGEYRLCVGHEPRRVPSAACPPSPGDRRRSALPSSKGAQAAHGSRRC